MNAKGLAVIAAVWIVLSPPPQASASPTAPKCSQVEYRTNHLQECNLQNSPGLGLGGGGGSGSGLIGGILKRVPGIGGLF